MYHIIITITLHKPVITISISLTFGISNCQFYRYDNIIVVAPKCTFLGVLVHHNNVSIALYKTHWIWLVVGIEWVTLGMNEGWRQKVRENECRNVWMQVIKQLKRMNGMSVLVNDIKMVGVQKMTLVTEINLVDSLYQYMSKLYSKIYHILIVISNWYV